MAHLVSPTGFRAGQTSLWSGSSLTFNNSNKLVSSSVNLSTGLENAASGLLRRENYYVVHSTTRLNVVSGVPQLFVLYYPLSGVVGRKRQFPLYTNQRLALSRTKKYNERFVRLLAKLWTIKFREFNSRFLSSRRKVQLNRWLSASMLRGSSGVSLRAKPHKMLKVIQHSLLHYRTNLSRWSKWQRSKTRLSSRHISNLLSARLGVRTKVKTMNVFRYLASKFGRFRFKTHQNHIWRSYHRSKRFFTTFYDVVNAFYLLCMMSNMEKFLIVMLQYSLIKMHRRKIKPKRFFYFIDSIIKAMPQVKTYFHACRVVVTGKLKGGTARTGSYSAGFGVLPRQSLSQDIKMNFGNVHSKYGSFGIKLLTWRKKSPFKLPTTFQAI